jgi:hypothetical protein
MQSVLLWLQGKKTYIVAAIALLFNIGVSMGWWVQDDKVWQAIDGIFAALGLASLRAGVTKSASVTDDNPKPPPPPPPKVVESTDQPKVS